MRQRKCRVPVSLCFLLLLAVAAQAQYQRPMPTANDGPPTYSDLETYDGASRSITVQLLNLTPYDITFVHNPGVTWSITVANEQDDMQDRFGVLNQKSFMFVPVGIPSFIPAAPAQSFLDPGDPGYDPNYVDTTTHPYPMVFSWDDRGGFVVDNWVTWTIKGVKYYDDKGAEHHQDVQLGLWMYRNKPVFGLISSGLLQEISDAINVVFKTMSLVVGFENPAAWINEFLAATELAKGSKELAKENSQANDGNTMWVASYVIPSSSSPCGAPGSTMVCRPSSMAPDETGDAVYSQWGSTAGYAEANLVVSVYVLRGQKANQCDPTWYPNKCPLGSESTVMITLMRPEEFVEGWLASHATTPFSSATLTGNTAPTSTDPIQLFLLQAGAGRIRQLLVKQGRPGLDVLRSVIEGLDPAQRQVLTQMIQTMGTGRLPTQQERRLVHLIADELQARLK